MDFNLTEEQLMIQQAARDFAQSELFARGNWDEFSKFPEVGNSISRDWFDSRMLHDAHCPSALLYPPAKLDLQGN
jgi:hypothetical protein